MTVYLPTLGGKQFWTDLRVTPAGWRVQRHVITGHCRLLDAADFRRAWGTFAECDAALCAHAPPAPPPAPGRPVVVLVHGLGRSRRSMRPMARVLCGHDFEALEFGYASTRAPVEHHADALASVVAGLSGFAAVHFVGHSLGNLVVRRYLAKRRATDRPSVGRVVMLAPPNAGSRLAARLRRNPAFLLGMGPAGQEIAEWTALSRTLATPADFGVIAGNCRSLNPLLRDPAGDLVVCVEETRLAGMADFREMDVTHTFLMRNQHVIRQTVTFLRTGRFD